jgi:hypothetical protein
MNLSNDPEMKSFGGNDSQIEALQRQVFILMLVLLVVSASLAAYLIYESHIFHKDTENLRGQATPIINAYNAEQPYAANFLNQIRAFGATNPDFNKQVLSKYGIQPLQPTNASAKSAPVKIKK